MKYDPATGEQKPYPSHAEQWRHWHGHSTAWLFNPWTGARRLAGDVGTDVVGLLIIPPNEQVYGSIQAWANISTGMDNLEAELAEARKDALGKIDALQRLADQAQKLHMGY